MNTEKIRVLLADDHKLFREMLYHTLSAEPDIQVVGEAVNGIEAVEKNRELKPDVVLLDIDMPKMNGLLATQKIKEESESTKIVILTALDEDTFIFQLIKAGASGYLLKDTSVSEVITAIRVAFSGESLIQPKIVNKILQALVKMLDEKKVTHSEKFTLLTERETEVLKLVAQGLNNREIAEKLFISEPTVKTHISNIMHKLNLRDRVEMVLFAMQNNLVNIEDPSN